jgi:hypothetical protein
MSLRRMHACCPNLLNLGGGGAKIAKSIREGRKFHKIFNVLVEHWGRFEFVMRERGERAHAKTYCVDTKLTADGLGSSLPSKGGDVPWLIEPYSFQLILLDGIEYEKAWIRQSR